VKKKALMGALVISALLLFEALFVEAAQANPFEIPPPDSIFIRSDGSVSGTDKIVQNGNMYTLTDNIALSYKFIVIQRNNITLDGAGFTVTGDYALTAGVYISERSNITIKNFRFTNLQFAIQLVHAQQITICNNTMTNNQFAVSADHNITGLNYTFYFNNFLFNHFDVGQTTGYSWDNGSVGNFWSNYTGSDLNGDGIGDTPYQITLRDTDNYPLMTQVPLPMARPDPTVAPDPTPSASEPDASDYEPVESPTLPPQNLPTPSPSSVPSPSPSPTLSPTLEPTLEPTQTAKPTNDKNQTLDLMPILVLSGIAVATVAVGALVYFKRRKG
jgi:hypothetical protein